jgi:hypothetical protein
VFVDGKGFEAVYETTEGPVYVGARVAISQRELFLTSFVIYSGTGYPLVAGTGQMLQIIRHIEDDAREQGLIRYTISAVRKRRNRPERIISITRRLL